MRSALYLLAQVSLIVFVAACSILGTVEIADLVKVVTGSEALAIVTVVIGVGCGLYLLYLIDKSFERDISR